MYIDKYIAHQAEFESTTTPLGEGRSSIELLIQVARQREFESLTFSLEEKRSIQLSYWRRCVEVVCI